MQKAKNKKNNPNGVFACRKIVKQPAQVTFNTFYTTLHRSSCIVTKGQTHLNMRSSRPDLLNKHRSVLLFGRYKEGRLFFRLCTRLVTRITLRKKFRCGGEKDRRSSRFKLASEIRTKDEAKIHEQKQNVIQNTTPFVVKVSVKCFEHSAMLIHALLRHYLVLPQFLFPWI